MRGRLNQLPTEQQNLMNRAFASLPLSLRAVIGVGLQTNGNDQDGKVTKLEVSFDLD